MYIFNNKGKLLRLLFLCLSTTLIVGEEFRGAVVEYGAKYVKTSSKETVLANVESYKNIVESLHAKFNDLKIVVFPEGGLSSYRWLTGEKSLIYGEIIPDIDPNKNLCDSSLTDDQAIIIKNLSCIAKTNSVYLVVNLVEKASLNNTDVLYNTNVVFNANGSLIARYRKYNLFGFENKVFQKPENVELVYFDTDFGVRFGTFIGFDILFKTPGQDLISEPYNATHIAYPVAWKNELPFHTAIQEHFGWSNGTNKVLMAAGLNEPKLGATGTGIYFGKLVINENENVTNSIQSQIKGDFSIVSKIPKALNMDDKFYPNTDFVPFYNTSNLEIVPLKISTDKLNVFKTKLYSESDKIEIINPYLVQPKSEYNNLTLFKTSTVNETVCDGDFCCEFTFNVTKIYILDLLTHYTQNKFVGDNFGMYKYRLAVFNGVKSFDGIKTGGVQVCSIISCLDNNIDSCGKRTEGGSPESITEFGGYKFIQDSTIFWNVNIKAELKTQNNTFVSSNILLSSRKDYDDQAIVIAFGRTPNPKMYNVTKISATVNGTTSYLFKGTKIPDPASINLYNRYYDIDGSPETTTDDNGSGSINLSATLLFLTSSLLLLKTY